MTVAGGTTEPTITEAALPDVTSSGSSLLRARRVAGDVLLRIAPIAAFIVLWQVIVDAGLLQRSLFPTPTTVASAIGKMFADGTIWPNLEASLIRAGVGFGLAAAVGVGLGILIGTNKFCARVLSPLFEVARQLSAFAIYPIMVLLIGIGYRSQIAVVFWAAVWPILLNTISGTRTADATLVKAVRSLGASRLQMFYKLVLPSSVPNIMTGVRLGGSYAILVLVGAEIIGAQNGLGYLVITSQFNFDVPQMYAAIVLLAILGLIVNYSLLGLERRFSRWRQFAAFDS